MYKSYFLYLSAILTGHSDDPVPVHLLSVISYHRSPISLSPTFTSLQPHPFSSTLGACQAHFSFSSVALLHLPGNFWQILPFQTSRSHPNCHFFKEVFPDHHNKFSPTLSYTLSSPLLCNIFSTIYHYLKLSFLFKCLS